MVFNDFIIMQHRAFLGLVLGNETSYSINYFSQEMVLHLGIVLLTNNLTKNKSQIYSIPYEVNAES